MSGPKNNIRKDNNGHELAALDLAKYDRFHPAVTIIEAAHRAVHDGVFHTVSGKELAWGAAAQAAFLIDVPLGVFPHFQVMNWGFGKGDIDIQFYEGGGSPDLGLASPLGTLLPSQNANRNSANVADVQIFNSTVAHGSPLPPTFADLWVPNTATGIGQSADGIQLLGRGSEFVLKQGTPYLIVLTNGSGAEIAYSFQFAWYELDFAQ